jgi:hypothetical protein
VRLLARESPITICDDGPDVSRRGQRDGGDRVAGRECGQQVGPALVGAGQRDQARGSDCRRRERAWVHSPAELLEHNGHVDHAHARAAVHLGHQQARRAERGEPRPHVVARAALVVEHLAHVRDRRPLREEAAHRRAQELLILAELEVQGAGL